MGKLFRISREGKLLIKIEPNAEPETFKCIICGECYGKELQLYVHITSHARDITITETTGKMNNVSSDAGRGNNIHEKRFSTNTNKENQRPSECWHTGNTKNDEFRCEICSKTFPSKEKLDRHGKSHVRPYQCEICLKNYKFKQGLLWHIKSIHDIDRFHRCQVCGKLFSAEEQLQHHLKASHSEIGPKTCFKKVQFANQEKAHLKGIKCPTCGVFIKKEDLKAHLSEHENYECDSCKESFPSKKLILSHLIKTHLHSTDRKMKEEELKYQKKEKKRRVKVEKPFKCDVENCHYSTSQSSLLKAHKFKHNPFYKCITCQDKLPSRQELKAHMSTHGERPYKCDQCNKCYKDKHGLGWHKKVQHDPSRLRFTCELCGKTYPFVSLLTQHINLTHAAEKQSVCDICGKNVSKTYLHMHRRTHGEKQFSCDVCQKTFLEKAYLKRHKMIHTGEKPYVCNVCGNLFRQHSTLTIHMRTHTGDRPYKCIMCENAYKTHHNLKKHYRRSGHKLV